tara:strand:+ start:819 stop:1238 length:420 start_codon:yes stop_codon:yes gene_type:complete
MKFLFALLLLLAPTQQALAQEPKKPQSMRDAAESFRICRTILKEDRDRSAGRRVAQAWIDSAPSGAEERQPRRELMESMVEAYTDYMKERKAYGAIGCSEGIFDRVQNQNWSSFHQGIREVLMKEGMAELMTPGSAPGQ